MVVRQHRGEVRRRRGVDVVAVELRREVGEIGANGRFGASEVVTRRHHRVVRARVLEELFGGIDVPVGAAEWRRNGEPAAGVHRQEATADDVTDGRARRCGRERCDGAAQDSPIQSVLEGEVLRGFGFGPLGSDGVVVEGDAIGLVGPSIELAEDRGVRLASVPSADDAELGPGGDDAGTDEVERRGRRRLRCGHRSDADQGGSQYRSDHDRDEPADFHRATSR